MLNWHTYKYGTHNFYCLCFGIYIGTVYNCSSLHHIRKRENQFVSYKLYNGGHYHKTLGLYEIDQHDL